MLPGKLLAVGTGREVEPNSKRWTTVSDSAFDHEREALAWLRRELKDQDPNRGWSNFEFVTRSGSLYENPHQRCSALPASV